MECTILTTTKLFQNDKNSLGEAEKYEFGPLRFPPVLKSIY